MHDASTTQECALFRLLMSQIRTCHSMFESQVMHTTYRLIAWQIIYLIAFVALNIMLNSTGDECQSIGSGAARKAEGP